jgi:hypothetical protein
MASMKPDVSESNHPRVLGADGRIDLTGGTVEATSPSERPTAGPSGDAWVLDRDRRSLLPPAFGASATAVVEAAAEVPDDIHQEIADRFALGDYGAALSAAELQLGVDPKDESARQYAETSRQRLEARYTTRIGSLDFVFNLGVPATKVKWLGLDPQAASLLALVDGQSTVAEVLELCEMKRLEALRVFTELLDAKAILRVA